MCYYKNEDLANLIIVSFGFPHNDLFIPLHFQDLPEMVSMWPLMSHLGSPAVAVLATKLSHKAYS